MKDKEEKVLSVVTWYAVEKPEKKGAKKIW